jgi:hypothetical protein
MFKEYENRVKLDSGSYKDYKPEDRLRQVNKTSNYYKEGTNRREEPKPQQKEVIFQLTY